MNNSVKHCCICDNKKYGVFIDINDEKYHLCCIEQLQQENKQLKDNWNKLKEFAQEKINNPTWASCGARYILEKMQELEKGDSNDI